MARHHGVRLTLLLVLCTPQAMLAGCWRAGRLEPPDLSEQELAVSTELSRQRSILTIMERDMATLSTLTHELLAEPTSAYAPPFPLQTFTLTIVSCFNEPIALRQDEFDADTQEALEDLPETPTDAAARRFGVTCLPASLSVLERKLDALSERGVASAPTMYALSRTQLQRVESIRVLRHRLHARQSVLKPLIREARQLLEQERATWRRIATGVDARRLDYTPDNLARARERLRAQQKRLAELEAAINALEEAHKHWPAEMASMLDSLVYELAWLGRS